MSDIDEFCRSNTRPTSLVTIGGFRPTGNPLSSHFGLAPVSLPEEAWPCIADCPLHCICQFNLTEAPHVPEALRDLALITVFMDMRASRLGKENGAGWLVRTYRSLDGLLPLSLPPAPPMPRTKRDAPLRGFEVKYELADDHPVSSDPELLPVAGVARDEIVLTNIYRTKLGGYPSNIQSEQWWSERSTPEEPRTHASQPRYCFQIACEEKVGLFWGDNGILYFARGAALGCESQWFLDAQCY